MRAGRRITTKYGEWYPDEAQRERMEAEGWSALHDPHGSEGDRLRGLMRVIRTHYYPARRAVEAMPRKLRQQIHGVHTPRYTLDIDVYTCHWLHSMRDHPALKGNATVAAFIERYGYEPRPSRFLPDGCTEYQLPLKPALDLRAPRPRYVDLAMLELAAWWPGPVIAASDMRAFVFPGSEDNEREARRESAAMRHAAARAGMRPLGHRVYIAGHRERIWALRDFEAWAQAGQADVVTAIEDGRGAAMAKAREEACEYV